MTAPLYYARNPNYLLYVNAITSAYRAGYRVYDPDYALAREPDILEKALRDPIINHAVQIRLHTVAGKRWIIEPASDDQKDEAAAKVIETLLKQIENFLDARTALALACMTARTYAYIEGRRRRVSVANGPEMDWWVPLKLRDIDRRRIYYEPRWNRSGPSPVLDVGYKIWSIARGRFEDWTNPEYFIKCVYQDSESRLGYGRGLLEAIYYYHYAKTTVLKEGLQGVERWAQGMLVGKIDGLRDASDGKNNDEIQKAWLAVLEQMRSRHVAVHDKMDEISIVQGPGQGHDMVVSFLNYLDNAITRLILGAVLPSGGDLGSGSFARAETEAETMSALIQYDRHQLDESITRDLVSLVWTLNRPQLSAMGLADARKPSFCTVPEDREDPERNARIFSLVLAAGIPLRRDEVYKKLGLTPPAPGDDVIMPSVAPIPGGTPIRQYTGEQAAA